MSELSLRYFVEEKKDDKLSIKIEVENTPKENALYKFIGGISGVWNTICDFQNKPYIIWEPEGAGNYTVMVQCRTENSRQNFNYIGKVDINTLELSKTIELNNKNIEDQLMGKKDIHKEVISIHENKDIFENMNLYENINTEDICKLDEEEIRFLTLGNKEELEEVAYTLIGEEVAEITLDNIAKINDESANVTAKDILKYKKIEERNINDTGALIQDVILNKQEFFIGEKININVIGNSEKALYKYSIKEKQGWEIIKDYSLETSIIWTLRDEGEYEILVEGKNIDTSSKLCDEFKTVNLLVKGIKKPEIKFIKPLNKKLLCNNELSFEVEIDCDVQRITLYKFYKRDGEGNLKCIQDYSSKRVVSYFENKEGKYQLLCYTKDMYSSKAFDDRGMLTYVVKPYDKVSITNFTTDISSPQKCSREITLKALCEGGNSLRYNYVIEYGEETFETGFISEDSFVWKPKYSGKYKCILYVKDVNFSGDYEDEKSFEFIIKDNQAMPAIIKDVHFDRSPKILIDETINIKVSAQGGNEILYKFIIRKGSKIKEEVDFSPVNWRNFFSAESGKYEVEVLVKDKDSLKEYDSKDIVYINVMEYIPSKIDYILLPQKEKFIIDDKIAVSIVAQNSNECLTKYILKIEGHLVEETEYRNNHSFLFTPKCKGRYSLEVYSKNVRSDKDYDDKKVTKFNVLDIVPITGTRLKISSMDIKIHDTVEFVVACDGGREIEYEFYLYEDNDWNLVQKYSRKNFYSFMTFREGTYKLLALVKSRSKSISYEDYDFIEFEVK